MFVGVWCVFFLHVIVSKKNTTKKIFLSESGVFSYGKYSSKFFLFKSMPKLLYCIRHQKINGLIRDIVHDRYTVDISCIAFHTCPIDAIGPVCGACVSTSHTCWFYVLFIFFV